MTLNNYEPLTDEWEKQENMLLDLQDQWKKSPLDIGLDEELAIYEIDEEFLTLILKEKQELLKRYNDRLNLMTYILERYIKRSFKDYPTEQQETKWRESYYFLAPRLKHKIATLQEDISRIKREKKHLVAKQNNYQMPDVKEARKYPIVKLFKGKLRIGNINAIGHCPFHDEKSPSFTINLEKNKYNCFGCGAYGDVVDFYMKINRVDFITALKALT